MTTLYEAKGQARRLSEYLASLNLSLNHSQALEAIARSRGAQSWNVFSSEAALAADSDAQSTSPGRPSADAELLTFESILRHARAHEYGAVHIRARRDEITVSQRVRGLLRPVAKLGAADALALGMNMRIGFKGLTAAPYRATLRVDDMDAEVCTLPVMGGFDTVLTFPRVPLLHELGLTDLRTWSRLVKAGRGLLLVGGDTVAAQDVISATAGAQMLYADTVSHHVADRKSWIGLPSNQSEPSAFATGIMSALRADPNVIVAEIQNADTLHHLLTAAETGHLVIASLRSLADPAKVLQRLLSFVPASETSHLVSRLQSCLSGILSQQPAYPVCEHCNGEGCSDCFGTGRGIAEVLSTLWVPGGPGTHSVGGLLAGTAKYRTLADDLAVKKNLGLRFDEDVLKSL